MIRNALAVARHALIGLLVMVLVTAPWSILAPWNLRLSPHAAWAIPVTAAYLAVLLLYLQGRGWPSSTAGLRRRHLRARFPGLRALAWALLAGAASVASLWFVFAAAGGFARAPAPGCEAALSPGFLIAFVVASAAVTAIGEEAGLRGFMQAPLEAQVGAKTAIAATSVLFVLIHASHGLRSLALYAPFYLAAGIVYGTLACLTRSILPSLLLHFLGDIGLFALRTSLIRISPVHGTPVLLCVAGATICALGGVLGFVRLAMVTASDRRQARDSERRSDRAAPAPGGSGSA